MSRSRDPLLHQGEQQGPVLCPTPHFFHHFIPISALQDNFLPSLVPLTKCTFIKNPVPDFYSIMASVFN